ncbi:MAG: HAD family hydrolase [Synergistaceae bacterium]|nr:HAD family hydrolase [Synergistaceae bacterium]
MFNNKNNIKLMIFDNDMTLVDSSRAILAGFNQVADKVGRPKTNLQRVMECIAMPLPDFCRGLLGDYKPEWVDMYLANSSQNENKYLTAFKDSKQALKALRDKGVKLAMASNRERVEPVLKRTGLIEYFDDYIAARAPHGNFNYKPEPDMLLKLLELFNVNADQAVYVGDSDVDAETANNANMRFIGVPRGYFNADSLLKLGAWRVINNSLLELADFIN